MHTLPDFPISVPVMITWAIALLIVALGFVQTIISLNRKGHRRIIVFIFALLLMAGTAIHVILLARSSHTVTEGNWIQLVLVSMIASLEMFVGHTVVFDDIIAAVIFREPLLMIAYITIYLLIVVFTLSLAILILPRRLRDKTWLMLNEHKKTKHARKNHIFLGITPHTKMLVKNLLDSEDKPDGEIILVDFPGKEGQHKELSIGELLSSIFGRRKERTLEEELGFECFVLLRGRLPGQEEKGGNLCHAIGLDKLQPWLSNPKSYLYLLSENDEERYLLLEMLSADQSIQARTFCYASQTNSYTSLLASQFNRIHLLNPEELSFMELKQHQQQLHPIHFAQIARDSEGKSLGYVTSGISALLLGFEEAGQEALRFLYEYGSFIGKDLEPVQNQFHVYDNHIEALKGNFLNRTPALRYDASINWSDAPMGSSQFWLEFAMMLPSLNYVVITEDKGHHNVEIAIRLLQEAARYGKDLSRLCILVNAWDADQNMLEMIDFYNLSYCPKGVSVIHPFGQPRDIWKPDVITGKKLKKQSVLYADILRKEGATDESWSQRSERIKAEGLQDHGRNYLRKHLELMRKQAGDIGRSLFAHTILELADPSLYPLANQIPVKLDADHPSHFPHKNGDYERLEYLAAGEHLHWMTALMAAGYIDGNGQQDELNKKIKNLVPYRQLPDEQARHISWMAVKAALIWASQQQ